MRHFALLCVKFLSEFKTALEVANLKIKKKFIKNQAKLMFNERKIKNY